MTDLIVARGLSKAFGSMRALDNVNFHVQPGRIVGLIGPNGAGKTTALKAMLGLTRFDGELSVLGLDPYHQRHRLMQDVCFIADVAVLPRWIRVSAADRLRRRDAPAVPPRGLRSISSRAATSSARAACASSRRAW